MAGPRTQSGYSDAMSNPNVVSSNTAALTDSQRTIVRRLPG